ncbi:unnamed protein product [Miscanthus lutarioriparius]|uniref:Uncharacterized protein n=1 Tax=Miscanthus lutarioriparius TaxID=422564 RepID=A0A811N8W6_9POAL|nr:unnamed protein product [Miscanthus lutarioriparius]
MPPWPATGSNPYDLNKGTNAGLVYAKSVLARLIRGQPVRSLFPGKKTHCTRRAREAQAPAVCEAWRHAQRTALRTRSN